MKLASYFNRQFTGHISTHDWDGCGPNYWRWTLGPLSLSSAAVIRLPMTDPLCHRSPKMLLTLNEIIEWGMVGNHSRTMPHRVETDGTHNGPAQPSCGGGLEHDCSTGNEIKENEDNEAANAWNAPSQRRKARMIAMHWRLLSLTPGVEIVLRKNAKGTVKCSH